MKDKSNLGDIQIVKFLSVIFNPNNYPMSKKKLESVAKGIFKHSNLAKNILGNFSFSSEKYFIEQNSFFNPEMVVASIKNTVQKWDKPEYVFAFSLIYNGSEDKKRFNELIKSCKVLKNNQTAKKYFKAAISKVKPEKYVDNRSHLDLESISIFDFCDYERFYNFYSPFEYSSTVMKLFSSMQALSYYTWAEIIDFLPHKFLKILYNSNFFFFGNTASFFLKQVNENSSDEVISFAILNIISRINDQRKTGSINDIFKIIKILPTKKRFYWLGLLISNAEYMLNNSLREKFDKKAKNILIEELSKIKTHKNALEQLKKGLKKTPRNCHIKCFSCFRNFQNENKKLAIRLAKEIFEDYNEKINSEDNYGLLIHTNKEVEYCNAIIDTILYLYTENKINIYNIFRKWNKKIFIDKEDFGYSYSNQINLKNKAFHLFVVELLVFESLKLQEKVIDEIYLKSLINTYIDWINDFSYHLDAMENFSINNIFKLNILKEYLQGEINYIYNLKNPEFKFLATLVRFDKNGNNDSIVKFMEDYFDKYSVYWDFHKTENWIEIWHILGNIEKINQCLPRLPEWKQREYKKLYKL